MLVQQKSGNLQTYSVVHKTIEWLTLQWFETNKRIQIKHTDKGREMSLKFLNENPQLTQGDILFEDDNTIVAVDVMACDCMVICPVTMFEMAAVCYEIGNKHLPLFFDNNDLLVPFEMPLFKLITAQGFIVKQEQRKLLQPLKTSVNLHVHSDEIIFTKIMKLRASPPSKGGINTNTTY